MRIKHSLLPSAFAVFPGLAGSPLGRLGRTAGWGRVGKVFDFSHEDTKMWALSDSSVVIVGDAPEAILEGALAKVDEKPQWKLHQAKIREHLLAVDRGQALNRLQLHNEGIFDQQIDPEGVVYDNAIVGHPDGHLSLHPESGLPDGLGHQCLVGTLEEAGAKLPMQTIATINDAARGKLQIVRAQHLRVFV